MSTGPNERVIEDIKTRSLWRRIVYGEPHPAGVWDTFYCSCEYCTAGPLEGQWRLCAFHGRMQEALERGLDLESDSVQGNKG